MTDYRPSVKEIMECAKEAVIEAPGGLRHKEVWLAVKSRFPNAADGTLSANLSGLAGWFPAEIAKPSRGLFVSVASIHKSESADAPAVNPSVANTSIREDDFYESFAEFLHNDLDEVVVARSLGGAGLKNKWGTPDVVGVYKPLAHQRVKFEPEIVSAEIKIDPTQSVVAFGQAAAYRLFSSKVYVVMPSSIAPDELNRLEALCQQFGFGLVTFTLDKNTPNYQIRVRALRSSPDMFYVNDFADRLLGHNQKLFQELFG